MAEERRSSPLGKAVRIRRELLDLKRRDLADRAGLSYPYISEIENGVKQPSHSALQKIAVALEMEVSELAALTEGLEAVDAERSAAPVPQPIVASAQRRAPARSWRGDPLDAVALQSLGSSLVVSGLDPGAEDLVRDLVATELERFRREDLPSIVEAEVRRVLHDQESGS